MIFRTIFCEKNEITCINVSSISIKKNGSIMQVVIPRHSFVTLSSAEAFVFFFKPRKRGKGGKKGKAEKRERREKRERKGKATKASARFLSKYGKSCRYPTAHSLSAG